jgi:hypothetical protein
MDAPEPERKRLKQITERLEELRRLDIVKSLGERNLAHVVLQILQYLQLGEIWEVISHSVELRQWLHRQGIWKLLAEQRVTKEKREAFLARLGTISSVDVVNWFWYLCVENADAVKTTSGIYVQKLNISVELLEFEFLVQKMDNDLFSTMIRAFPDAKYKFTQEEMVVQIRIDDDGQEDIFASDETMKAALDAFLYVILARGGSVLVFVGNPNWEIDMDAVNQYLDFQDTEPFYSINFIRAELH